MISGIRRVRGVTAGGPRAPGWLEASPSICPRFYLPPDRFANHRMAHHEHASRNNDHAQLLVLGPLADKLDKPTSR
ncbi:hypothetical protein CKO15_06885 [Halorhodospira abdelmalekii]|nr:hypothetical protein [Halorhodospira abdelmalekii]